MFMVSRNVCFFFLLAHACLPDVSRLLGLTLRQSHGDSLTRGRLGLEHEDVRVSSSHSPRLVLHVMACAH